jgi:hypothetical protein
MKSVQYDCVNRSTAVSSRKIYAFYYGSSMTFWKSRKKFRPCTVVTSSSLLKTSQTSYFNFFRFVFLYHSIYFRYFPSCSPYHTSSLIILKRFLLADFCTFFRRRLTPYAVLFSKSYGTHGSRNSNPTAHCSVYDVDSSCSRQQIQDWKSKVCKVP